VLVNNHYPVQLTLYTDMCTASKTDQIATDLNHLISVDLALSPIEAHLYQKLVYTHPEKITLQHPNNSHIIRFTAISCWQTASNCSSSTEHLSMKQCEHKGLHHSPLPRLNYPQRVMATDHCAFQI